MAGNLETGVEVINLSDYLHLLRYVEQMHIDLKKYCDQTEIPRAVKKELLAIPSLCPQLRGPPLKTSGNFDPIQLVTLAEYLELEIYYNNNLEFLQAFDGIRTLPAPNPTRLTLKPTGFDILVSRSAVVKNIQVEGKNEEEVMEVDILELDMVDV